MFTTQTFAALSTAVALGFSACGHASAAPVSETASVKVSYQDLNLSTEAGARTMLRRIHQAAMTVCGREDDDPIDRIYGWLPCVKNTTNRAVAQFNNPIVTALNSGKSGSATLALASNR